MKYLRAFVSASMLAAIAGTVLGMLGIQKVYIDVALAYVIASVCWRFVEKEENSL